MNKVYVMGYVKELEVKKDKRGVDEATFKIKTKKTVGMKGNDWNEYYYIPCFIRGKKAKDMGNNLIDEQKSASGEELN